MPDWSILTFHVNAVRDNVLATPDRIRLAMGGLTEPDESEISHHLRWGERSLRVGSRVTITIVDADDPDQPISRYRCDEEIRESAFTDEEMRQMRYEDYLALKAEFDTESSS